MHKSFGVLLQVIHGISYLGIEALGSHEAIYEVVEGLENLFVPCKYRISLSVENLVSSLLRLYTFVLE